MYHDSMSQVDLATLSHHRRCYRWHTPGNASLRVGNNAHSFEIMVIPYTPFSKAQTVFSNCYSTVFVASAKVLSDVLKKKSHQL
jgi:hypothetical protein